MATVEDFPDVAANAGPAATGINVTAAVRAKMDQRFIRINIDRLLSWMPRLCVIHRCDRSPAVDDRRVYQHDLRSLTNAYAPCQSRRLPTTAQTGSISRMQVLNQAQCVVTRPE